LPAKAIPEMTYTVSGGMLNPTHSLSLVHYAVQGATKLREHFIFSAVYVMSSYLLSANIN